MFAQRCDAAQLVHTAFSRSQCFDPRIEQSHWNSTMFVLCYMPSAGCLQSTRALDAHARAVVAARTLATSLATARTARSTTQDAGTAYT